jgi:hypothetical protein
MDYTVEDFKRGFRELKAEYQKLMPEQAEDLDEVVIKRSELDSKHAHEAGKSHLVRKYKQDMLNIERKKIKAKINCDDAELARLDKKIYDKKMIYLNKIWGGK